MKFALALMCPVVTVAAFVAWVLLQVCARAMPLIEMVSR